MEILLSFALGAAGSLIASAVFLAVIRNYRPNLIISPEIAKISEPSRTEYTIKILNKGKRSVINLKFELLIVTNKFVPDGTLSSTKKLKLEKDYAFVLCPYSKKDRDAKYARRIYMTENLDKLWADDDQSFIVFRVYGHDELSGFAKLFEKEFRKKKVVIKEGEFHFGDSFEIS